MNYRLVVLTHGDAPQLEPCLESFREMVTPQPTSRHAFVDGDGALPPVEPLGPFEGWAGGKQLGFCGNCELAWLGAALADGHEHVFWLENDFVFTRPLDLQPLAAVLDANPMLAQMALMRNAVSDVEIAAGGLVESRPGEYEQRFSGAETGAAAHPWFEHRSYLTTNPSLMRRGFMAANPWPDYTSECEGRFGIDLVARGYSFGVWGSGEPWVDHVGERVGHGY